jgi:hypothetical protein
VSEDLELTARLPELHNLVGVWQGPMRVGWFDLVATRHALEIAGPVDGLVLTCLDRLSALDPLAVCTAYRDGDERLTRLPPPPQDRAARLDLTAKLHRCAPELTPAARRAPRTQYARDPRRSSGAARSPAWPRARPPPTAPGLRPADSSAQNRRENPTPTNPRPTSGVVDWSATRLRLIATNIIAAPAPSSAGPRIIPVSCIVLAIR